MDGGAWQVVVVGLQRVELDWVTNTFTFLSLLLLRKKCFSKGSPHTFKVMLQFNSVNTPFTPIPTTLF